MRPVTTKIYVVTVLLSTVLDLPTLILGQWIDRNCDIVLGRVTERMVRERANEGDD